MLISGIGRRYGTVTAPFPALYSVLSANSLSRHIQTACTPSAYSSQSGLHPHHTTRLLFQAWLGMDLSEIAPSTQQHPMIALLVIFQPRAYSYS